MINGLKVLALVFLQICLLRRAPQDIPASSLLLAMTLLLHFLFTVLAAMLDPNPQQVMLIAVIECLCLLAFVYVVLLLRSRTNRWQQTVTALVGTGIIIKLIFFPVLMLLPGGGGLHETPTSVMWAVWLLSLWGLLVLAHIFRHALSVPFILGAAVAIAYCAVNVTAISQALNWTAT